MAVEKNPGNVNLQVQTPEGKLLVWLSFTSSNFLTKSPDLETHDFLTFAMMIPCP